jgi:predicted  nucleic acid-binding Zn-ribbon protein
MEAQTYEEYERSLTNGSGLERTKLPTEMEMLKNEVMVLREHLDKALEKIDDLKEAIHLISKTF